MNDNRTWLSPGAILAAMCLINAAMTVAIQRRGQAVVLASGSVPVGFRLSHLLPGTAGSLAVLDQIVIVVWLVIAGFLVRALVRTTRAIAVNC